MDKQIIKTVIGEKQQQVSKTKLLQRAEQFDEHSCYVLVGIRRAGKSYTLYQDMQARLFAERNLDKKTRPGLRPLRSREALA